MAIDEIVKTSKTSALFDMMEQSLKDIKSNRGRIVEDRRQNLEKIQQQQQTFKTDIKEMRDKINKHPDKLEKKIQQDNQAAEQKAKSQIERLLSKVSDHEKSLNELQKNIFATKSFATDLQTFLGEDGSLQQINLKCKIDDKMSDILSMTEIGEISAIRNPPTITLTMDRDKQAQQMVPTISKQSMASILPY
ncbi:unnamed protein product [Mytilus coruscus]|uniref:Uncharacterized protein n=1 Tax=Mytilus coruscus TaxID=42192 RepID=A0A6J8AU80_MYTCO|nr:unnamed protein product [Mytilus coruscus]